MSVKKILTKDALTELLSYGLNQTEIASWLEVSQASVFRYLRKFGFTTAPPEIDLIKLIYQNIHIEKKSVEETATLINISRSRIYQIINNKIAELDGLPIRLKPSELFNHWSPEGISSVDVVSIAPIIEEEEEIEGFDDRSYIKKKADKFTKGFDELKVSTARVYDTLKIDRAKIDAKIDMSKYASEHYTNLILG